MNPERTDLLIRATALYAPLFVALALLLHRRPTRQQAAGVVVAIAWNLVTLLAMNAIAQRVGWWTFADAADVAGMPVDLWIGWVLLWGAIPALSHARPIIVGGFLVAADLVLMPLAAPVVDLQPTWLVGEAVLVVICLTPGMALARWTARDEHVARRAALQVVAFAGLLLYVVPTLILERTTDDWSALLDRPRWQLLLAAVIAAPPGAMALQAVREFAVVGHGTPVPLDPPRQLVTTGPYAYVANPMQIGATLLLAELGLLLGSTAVVVAAVMGAIFSAGIAAWCEQRELSVRFVLRWRIYRRHVRTWWPRWRPATHGDATLHIARTCEPCSEVGRFIAARRTQGLRVVDAEAHPDDLTRVTYEADVIGREVGIGALARSVEHIHLGWAVIGWIARLPGLRWLLQLITDAVGGGPRHLTQGADQLEQAKRNC